MRVAIELHLFKADAGLINDTSQEGRTDGRKEGRTDTEDASQRTSLSRRFTATRLSGIYFCYAVNFFLFFFSPRFAHASRSHIYLVKSCFSFQGRGTLHLL